MAHMPYEKPPALPASHRPKPWKKFLTAGVVGAALASLVPNFDKKIAHGPDQPKPPLPPPSKEKLFDDPLKNFEGGRPIGANTLKGTAAEHAAEFAAAKKVGAAYASTQELRKKLSAGELVTVEDSAFYTVSGAGADESDPEIRALFQTLRPKTKKLLDAFAETFFHKFKTKLKITSLTRTSAYVRELRKHNKNASLTSTHQFGTTFDFSHAVMTVEQKTWVAKELLKLEAAGVIEATMESAQPCFHVFVVQD